MGSGGSRDEPRGAAQFAAILELGQRVDRPIDFLEVLAAVS